jgi:hypothetical protein
MDAYWLKNTAGNSLSGEMIEYDVINTEDTVLFHIGY